MGGGSSPGQLDRTLDEHGDALFDFALAVTGCPERAAEAVCQAVAAAVLARGPTVGQAALLGAVLDAALRCAVPPVVLPELFRPGPGSRDELRQLARAAIRALDPYQRGVVDLALRQGLDGEALSEALGVSPGLAAATTKAALDEADQVVGAVLLARLGQEDCQGLVDLLNDPAVIDAERRAVAVNEHLAECPTCRDRRRALVPVASLLSSMPPTPAPPELRWRLRRGGWSGQLAVKPHPGFKALPWRLPSGGARRALAAGLMAIVIAASVGLAVATRGHSGRRPGGLAGRLALRTRPLDFGPSDVNRTFEVANTGGQPLHFTVRSGAPWLRPVSDVGTLAPGQRLVVGVALDRTAAPEGEPMSELRVRSTGGSGVIPVRAGVERPPGLSGLESTPQAIMQMGCPGSMPAQIRAIVVEESGIRHVELHWRGPHRMEQVAEMAGDAPSSFVGTLGPVPTAGDLSWWVSATDIRGNSATSAPESLRVSGC